MMEQEAGRMKVYLDRIVVSCYTHFYAPIDGG